MNHRMEVGSNWFEPSADEDKVRNNNCNLTFSFLITNDDAPLGSCLSSLRPPSRLRLVVPWCSC